jgi:glutaredoxin
MSARCAVHEIAVGPDGLCVLCRRALSRPPPAVGSRLAVVGLVVLSLAVGAAVTYRVAQRAIVQALAGRDGDQAAEPAAATDAEVRLFVTSWCPHCKRARAWLRANRVPFVEVDVEGSAQARTEHRRLNPRGGVPTLAYRGKVVGGFSEDEYRRVLALPADPAATAVP